MEEIGENGKWKQSNTKIYLSLRIFPKLSKVQKPVIQKLLRIGQNHQ